MEAEEILANQLPALRNLEVILLRARELAERHGESVAVYFIDMAILEARRKSPSTTAVYKSQAPKQ
jgi:hypothetical protein